MKNFYFTFGKAHTTINGLRMANYYVMVTAPDYGIARDHFCNHFAKHQMGSATKWAFQYTDEDFNPTFYPNGIYEHLTAPNDAVSDTTDAKL